MKKPKSVGSAVASNVWEAHIKKASGSIDARKQYKNFTKERDTYRIHADRIINGENISENWLKGRQKQELIDLGYCKESDFKKYNKPNGSINIG